MISTAPMRIRLSEWAAREGIARITAYRWARAGLVPNLVQVASGRLLVETDVIGSKKIALYARVSSADQKADLERQVERLSAFAAGRGLVVSETVSEIGSGLNGHRKKLLRLLRDPEVGTIIVEHRDRLARFGVEYLEALLSSNSRRLIVLNEGEERLDLVQDFIDVVTSMCARIYGRRAARNRAKRALEAAEAAGS